MNFIALDLELTCDKDVRDYPYQIIELAAVRCIDGVIDSVFQSYVKPAAPFEVTPFCTALTGITAEQLLHAPSIDVVAKSLSEFIQHKTPEQIISWGKSDLEMLKSECISAGAEFPLTEHLYQDFKKIYCKKRKIKKRVGLQTALKISEVSPQGLPHSALDDAKNLALLFVKES
ncbi:MULTISPECIES: 3'-5' exonuclease [Rheinheimera]|jgi:inhibitor of KinA sporulation pathway (predicted exonuclease)|uniref:3'-5' exonuclease n=1 Tax=Rheinheimera TaxID=67575 RepID=UPI000E8CB04F|nr:3'-5' exonuclease [Rheinheimera aquimaris]HBN89414.1 3'-5' exonuclease [Rheinheimera sp.]|tara:strand:- start:700 stop:1221 length:522 start_codon:yes stop_codon:yes gene_type:complete